MTGIDLTVTGNYSVNSRMVTEQTLDREGFFIPKPPQRCRPNRVKSALGIGRREQDHKPFGNNQDLHSRPQSAKYLQARDNKAYETDCNINNDNCDRENRPVQGDFSTLLESKKMSMNQKWVHQGQTPKWKPRTSRMGGNRPTRKLDKHDVRQQISVCEVMAKMRSNPSEGAGAAAPPSSPKSSSTSIVVGKRFVDELPMSPQQPNYLTYAKSNVRPKTAAKNRTSLSYLQEDMTVTNEPSNKSNRDMIDISTMDMYSTDEPDEESAAMVNETRPETCANRTTTQSELYESVYRKDYKESSINTSRKDHARIDRPKKNKNYVRYNPDTYRFQNNRFTKEKVYQQLWDREQLRPTITNTNVVSACRPSHSIYTGVS